MVDAGPHLELEWLARRRDGESVALIAWRDGVSPGRVRRITDQFGPFPRAHVQLGRTHLNADSLDARTHRWVQARRRGQSITRIAHTDGVAHQIISRATAGLGPYPGDDVIQQWVAARRNGQTLASIAAAYGTTAATVRSATRPHGPFSPPGPRLPPGVVGVKGIARMVGLTEPTLVRWVAKGRVPEPDFTTATGRKVWQTVTITRWLDDADFERCHCGARCVSLSRHQALAHRRPAEDTTPYV